MGCLTVGHRADNGDFVRDLSGLLQVLVEPHAGDHCFNRAHFTTVFKRRKRLRIEGLLLGPTAGEPDVNHTLGRPFKVFELLCISQS